MSASNCYIITTEQAQNKASLILKLLNKNGIEGKITATPKEFSKNVCAYCVKIDAYYALQAENILKRNAIKARVLCKS